MALSQRIVIVDDERAVRSGLSNLLHSDGYADHRCRTQGHVRL